MKGGGFHQGKKNTGVGSSNKLFQSVKKSGKNREALTLNVGSYKTIACDKESKSGVRLIWGLAG